MNTAVVTPILFASPQMHITTPPTHSLPRLASYPQRKNKKHPYTMSDEKVYSKFGRTYPKREIEAMDKKMHRRLKDLRAEGANSQCAECGAPTAWASVSLGVFICMNCAQVHRALGAHVSKVKSCMGTYLWCPDEMDAMLAMGNARANEVYGIAPPAVQPFDYSMGGSLFVRAQNRYEKGLYKGNAAKPAPAKVVSKPAVMPKKAASAVSVPAPPRAAVAKKAVEEDNNAPGWKWEDLDWP